MNDYRPDLMVSDFDRPPPGPDHKQMQKNDRFKLVLKQGFWTKITPVFFHAPKKSRKAHHKGGRGQPLQTA